MNGLSLQTLTTNTTVVCINSWHKPNQWLNANRKAYQTLIHESEADHDSYWTSAPKLDRFSLFDRFFDPIGWRSYRYVQQRLDGYLRAVRQIDIHLVLARRIALRDTHIEAPVGWKWFENKDSLCLVPSLDNNAIPDPEPYGATRICAEIIGS